MAREPRDYSALRTEHSLAPEHGDPTRLPQRAEDKVQEEPVRPATNQAPSPGWTEYGDMASQQASAIAYNNWLSQSYAARQQSALQADQKIEEARAGQDRIKEREGVEPRVQKAKELAQAVEARQEQSQQRDIERSLGDD
jgi:hypothetical protein